MGVGLIGCDYHAIYSGIANATTWKINDPFQGLFIFWIQNKTQIGDDVFDFFALIKTQTSVDAVRDVFLSQSILYRTRLGIGAVKHCKIIIRSLVLHHLIINHVGHKTTFVSVGHTAVYPNLLALSIGGPHDFFQTILIVLDNVVCRLHNVLG